VRMVRPQLLTGRGIAMEHYGGGLVGEGAPLAIHFGELVVIVRRCE
jgi:hypothetical protein